MKKYFLLIFAFLGVVLSSCRHDEDDISAINKVRLTESSIIRTNDNITITAKVENYTNNMECWLNVGRGADFMTDRFNYIWSLFIMNFDSSKKVLSTEIPVDYFEDVNSTLYGHIIVTDYVKHESTEIGEPIIFNSTQAN